MDGFFFLTHDGFVVVHVGGEGHFDATDLVPDGATDE